MQFKKCIIICGLAVTLLTPFVVVHAQDSMYGFPPESNPPLICGKSAQQSCPTELLPIYAQLPNDTCAVSYADFLSDPKTKHYWVEDPVITAQGKADERARQFIYWVITTDAIDNAPVLATIWRFTSMLTLFGVVLIAAIFGIGYIVSQRTNYDFKVRVWPTLIKLGTMLLYVALSSAVVFVLIQFSEILMKFSYENLGGKELFNIYFASPSQPSLIGATEDSYRNFVGCRDLNIRVNEGIEAQMFMLKMTNVSYYVMGVMLLLRKILLWFLLFVSPFLALLMPFILIRNTGWIWIGVFFQWLFYGPLVTLFLGGLAKIWASGIPFGFNFSRVTDISGYVYPTGINIVYGGPGQNSAAGRAIGALNNGSYVDTFAEYIITLIMLWAVTFFPWWLLRIFRDYCCDGIYAMKNILLAMYDNMRIPPPGKGPSPASPTHPSRTLSVDLPTNNSVHIALGSLEQIKKSMTQDITKNLSLSATKITDIARSQTNTKMQQTINQNLTYLANPVKASRPAERQQYMNLRSELFARAIKNDTVARTILAATSNSVSEKTQIRETIIKSIPQSISMTQMVTGETSVPKEAVTTITNSFTKSITSNTHALQSIATTTHTPVQKVRTILNSYNTYSSQPISNIVTTVAKETNTTVSTVRDVLKHAGAIGAQEHMMRTLISERKLDKTQVTRVLSSIRASVISKETIGSSVLESVSQTPVLSHSTIQTVINEFAQNQTAMESVATSTHVERTVVENVVKSFAQNLNQPATTIINHVAGDTHVESATVESILQNVAQSVSSSSSTQTQIGQASHVENTSVQHIAETIKQTVQTAAQASAPTITLIENSSSSSQEVIQSVVQSFGGSTQLTTQIAEETQIDQSSVQNVLNSVATHLTESSSQLITSISSETQTTEHQVRQILSAAGTAVTNSTTYQEQLTQVTQAPAQTIKQIAQAVTQVAAPQAKMTVADTILSTAHASEVLTQESITKIITQWSTHEALVTEVSQKTSVSAEHVKSIYASYATHFNESSEKLVASIMTETHATREEIQSVIQTTSEILVATPAQGVGPSLTHPVTESSVQRIATALPQSIASSSDTLTNTSLVERVSTASHITTAESQTIIQNLLSTALSNTSFIQNLAEQNSLKVQQVRNIITTYQKNSTATPEKIILMINESSGIAKDHVQNVLVTLTDSIISSDQIVGQVARDEGVEPSEVSDVMQKQMEVASEPEKNIEKTISIPQSISLQDYEEVKDMWTKHYEEGEVPVSETIQSRREWVDQEIVYITNTLNKILSPDERIQQEGLDELGYLLPIFLINNLKGEELIVYLKAKLEAAKLVQKLLTREQSIKDNMKKDQEEEDEVFVDIKKPEEKPQVQEMSFDDEENTIPSSIEDREKATQEKLAGTESEPASEESPTDPSLDGIRDKLQERADK